MFVAGPSLQSFYIDVIAMEVQKKLFNAVKDNDLATIKQICPEELPVGNGGTVDLNGIDEERGYTPLGAAIVFGHTDIAIHLCKVPSVDVNAVDKNGASPLCIAAREGDMAMAKHLCGIDGVEVNKRDNFGDSPLIIAALLGHITTVKVLADAKGIDVNIVHKKRGTPLCTAARNGNEKVVNYLSQLENVALFYHE